MKKIYQRLIGVLLTVIFSLSVIYIVDTNNFLYSYSFKITDNFYSINKKVNDSIVIVSIDDESLKDDNLGNWKDWKRQYYAQVIENIEQDNASVIGIDVLFFNDSDYEDDDQVLSNTLNTYDNIVLASKYDTSSNTFIYPKQEFIKSEDSLGFINIPIDNDNIVRRAYAFLNIDDVYRESFDLKILRYYITDSFKKDETSQAIKDNIYTYIDKMYRLSFNQNIKLGNIHINLVDDNSYFMNFFGTPNSYNNISFYKIFVFEKMFIRRTKISLIFFRIVL